MGYKIDNTLENKFEVYNLYKTHLGLCDGKTPDQTFTDGKKLFEGKNLDEQLAA